MRKHRNPNAEHTWTQDPNEPNAIMIQELRAATFVGGCGNVGCYRCCCCWCYADAHTRIFRDGSWQRHLDVLLFFLGHTTIDENRVRLSTAMRSLWLSLSSRASFSCNFDVRVWDGNKHDGGLDKEENHPTNQGKKQETNNNKTGAALRYAPFFREASENAYPCLLVERTPPALPPIFQPFRLRGRPPMDKTIGDDETGEHDEKNAEERDVDALYEEFQHKMLERVEQGMSCDEAYESLCGYEVSDIENELFKIKMMNMSLKQAAPYADYVTKRAPSNVGQRGLERDTFSDMNATGVANCAYVALHSIHKSDRARAVRVFRGWQRWFRNKVSDATCHALETAETETSCDASEPLLATLFKETKTHIKKAMENGMTHDEAQKSLCGHTSNDLIQMFAKLPTMTIEEVSVYGDYAAVRAPTRLGAFVLANDYQFTLETFNKIPVQLAASCVANLAHAAIHSQNEEDREKLRKWFHALQQELAVDP